MLWSETPFESYDILTIFPYLLLSYRTILASQGHPDAMYPNKSGLRDIVGFMKGTNTFSNEHFCIPLHTLYLSLPQSH